MMPVQRPLTRATASPTRPIVSATGAARSAILRHLRNARHDLADALSAAEQTPAARRRFGDVKQRLTEADDRLRQVEQALEAVT